MRVPRNYRLYRLVEPLRVEHTTERDVELHRIHIVTRAASNHSRLILVTAMRSSAVGAHVQVAFRCGPVSVSMVTALSSTV
ncbi:Uncharacterised protein [Mycobacteroides abscessus subsp. abscessus]|nr:Uncharacterised protein [Mycobacteroides abscessus subsp. abscessus]